MNGQQQQILSVNKWTNGIWMKAGRMLYAWTCCNRIKPKINCHYLAHKSPQIQVQFDAFWCWIDLPFPCFCVWPLYFFPFSKFNWFKVLKKGNNAKWMEVFNTISTQSTHQSKCRSSSVDRWLDGTFYNNHKQQKFEQLHVTFNLILFNFLCFRNDKMII